MLFHGNLAAGIGLVLLLGSAPRIALGQEELIYDNLGNVSPPPPERSFPTLMQPSQYGQLPPQPPVHVEAYQPFPVQGENYVISRMTVIIRGFRRNEGQFLGGIQTVEEWIGKELKIVQRLRNL